MMGRLKGEDGAAVAPPASASDSSRLSSPTWGLFQTHGAHISLGMGLGLMGAALSGWRWSSSHKKRCLHPSLAQP